MSSKTPSAQRVERLLQRARRSLRTARLAFDDGDYPAAINRAYYAVFYAANAALSSRGLERRKHTGVIEEFRVQFIRTGLIEREFSAFYGDVMSAREGGDYEFLVDVERNRAESVLDEADRLVARVERFLGEQSDVQPT